MWDPAQLAEISVLVDRLLGEGDPLGEWLAIRERIDTDAIRERIDGEGRLAQAERRRLRGRARALREQLGPRLRLAEVPDAAHGIRERGLLIDVSLAGGLAEPERLAELLGRPDAALLLRLRLRGDDEPLRRCVALLLEPGPARHLRELMLEREAGPGAGAAGGDEPLAELGAKLGEQLPDLFVFMVDGRPVGLPFSAESLAVPGVAWTAARRTCLGRALTSPLAEQRRIALERVAEHGPVAAQLRAPLLSILDREPEPRVREAALAVIGHMGASAHALLAWVADLAEQRDDPLLQTWLASMRAV